MTIAKFLIPAIFCLSALPASAAVQVLGNSSARLCYDAAEARSSPSKSSVNYCDEALRLENLSSYDTVATLVNRGILKLRSGAVDSAIEDFDMAIARNPNQAEAYLNKGMASLRLADGWAQAVSLFDTAIQKDTRRPALAYFGRAVAHELGGLVREAYLDYKQAAVIEPRWRDPQTELARFTVHQR